MSKTKLCLGCYQPFVGRKDAKTCSARCRKRVQRTRDLLTREIVSRSIVSSAPRAKTVNPLKSGIAGFLIVVSALLVALMFSGQGLALAQGYTTTDKQLKQGMVVSLSPGSNVHGSNIAVQAADYRNSKDVLGVAVAPTSGLIAEVPAGSQIYVEKSGAALAYVSDLNGDIKKGDYLTLSTLKGVLMRADNRSVTTVGTALEDFSAASAQSVSATDKDGNPVNVHVALLNINVAIQPPTPVGTAQSTTNFLDKLGLTLTGHKINSLRVLAAIAVFSTLLVIEGEIIYGTVTSSIVAVGRNPLAKKLVGWQSLRGAGIGIAILTLGTAAIAVLLWL